jgi:hypothetical protein
MILQNRLPSRNEFPKPLPPSLGQGEEGYYQEGPERG